MRTLVAFLILVAPCQAADWSFLKDSQLAQAKPVSLATCPCGDACACGDNATELRQLRAYKAKMEAWIAENDLRNPARYKTVSARVVSEPTYQEEPVCVNGSCSLPSQVRYSAPTSTPYTSGRYTRFFSGFKSFRGGSCAGGNCR